MRERLRGSILILGVAGVLGVLAACLPAATGSTDGSAAPERVELTVFAASSLTDAFGEIGADFEFLNEGLDVTYNFGASDTLAAQIQSEGTADVFASASEMWMDEIEEDPGVLDRGDFAENSLVIITPPDDPAEISSLEDLAKPDVQLVIGAQGVPVGDYAREMLVNAGLLVEVLPNIQSQEEDNGAIVARVESGEADAGIVYLSDVSEAAGRDLRAVEIDGDVNVTATYPIAVMSSTVNEDLARRFMAYVRGPEGQATLEAYGFEPLFLG